jgi:hypothetical protein
MRNRVETGLVRSNVGPVSLLGTRAAAKTLFPRQREQGRLWRSAPGFRAAPRREKAKLMDGDQGRERGDAGHRFYRLTQTQVPCRKST